MARQVITNEDLRRIAELSGPQGVGSGIAAAPAAAQVQPKADEFTERLIKYIPSEVIAVYVFIDGVTRAAPRNLPRETIQWVVFFVLLAGTWLYLWRVQNVTKRSQLIISTAAFAVWVFSLGGPFAALSWYSPIYAAILLPLYTFLVPIIDAKSA